MFLKTLCILSCVVGTVISTSVCVTENPCRCVKEGGLAIDLSTVASEGIPRFYEVSADGDSLKGLYSYNPCIPFNSPGRVSSLNEGNVICKDAAACVRTPGGNDSRIPEEHAIGLQNTAMFDSTPALGLHIKYSTPGAKQKLTVRLICNSDIPYQLVIDKPESETDKDVVMNLTSKCACDNGCKSTPPPETTGLSTGSKLLIAFFTIVLAYFVVGILWNLFNGGQGIEVVPNLDFWNDLPKLIVEGVLFSCSCFGKKSSYGEV